MFLQEFRKDFVLALDLLLQEGDAPIVGVAGPWERDSETAEPFSKNSFCPREDMVGWMPGWSHRFQMGTCSRRRSRRMATFS
jgi:hypothetical protein